jgi:hypothetical protein
MSILGLGSTSAAEFGGSFFDLIVCIHVGRQSVDRSTLAFMALRNS